MSRIFIFILISVFCLSNAQAKELAGRVENLARDFQLQDLNQNTVILSSYKNLQPVVLFFWTTWCPFCRKELRMLNNDVYPELMKEGWELFAIDVGEPAYKVDNFVKNYALTFKVLLDKDTTVTDSYEVLGIPTYVLVDKKGYIVFKDNYFPREEYKTLIKFAQ